jgi:hypothetical protein
METMDDHVMNDRLSAGGEHRHEEHQRTVYIGLVGALSVVGFFLFEKLVNVLGRHKNISTGWKIFYLYSRELMTEMSNSLVMDSVAGPDSF